MTQPRTKTYPRLASSQWRTRRMHGHLQLPKKIVDSLFPRPRTLSGLLAITLSRAVARHWCSGNRPRRLLRLHFLRSPEVFSHKYSDEARRQQAIARRDQWRWFLTGIFEARFLKLQNTAQGTMPAPRVGHADSARGRKVSSDQHSGDRTTVKRSRPAEHRTPCRDKELKRNHGHLGGTLAFR